PVVLRQTLGSPRSSPPSSGRKLTFQVWFVKGGELIVQKRTEPFSVAVGKVSLDGFAAGPSAPELAAQIRTDLPANATLTITALAGGNAMVDVEPPGQALQQETPAVRLEKAQIVYTLTQYSTIRKVTFKGRAFSGDTNLYGRAAFEDLLPAILVEGPLIGQRIANPVTVSGTANVFEATVSLRILDE